MGSYDIIRKKNTFRKILKKIKNNFVFYQWKKKSKKYNKLIKFFFKFKQKILQ